MRINNTINDGIVLAGDTLEEAELFTYLGSIIARDKDINARIGETRSAFLTLKPVWQSKAITYATKLLIFSSNVRTVLLYGCKAWKTNKSTTQNLQNFLNNDLYSTSSGLIKLETKNCGRRQGKKM